MIEVGILCANLCLFLQIISNAVLMKESEWRVLYIFKGMFSVLELLQRHPNALGDECNEIYVLRIYKEAFWLYKGCKTI